MKISKMIKELNSAKDKYGDIEVVMAQDSEGNSYCTIDENIKHSRICENEQAFYKAYSAGIILQNPKDAIDKFYDTAKVIGICIFPYAEYFNSAEEAVNYAKKKTQAT